ncbi:MAG: hypothetical protein ACJ8C0_10730, partial [Microvirga sp.]
NDVQRQACEPALDGVGDAEPRIKGGVAGGLGDAPMQRGDKSGARVSSEVAEDRHRRPKKVAELCLVKAATRRYGITLIGRKLQAPALWIPE